MNDEEKNLTEKLEDLALRLQDMTDEQRALHAVYYAEVKANQAKRGMELDDMRARAALFGQEQYMREAADRAAQVTTLRTLLLLDLDGYDVLRGELGGVVPRKVKRGS